MKPRLLDGYCGAGGAAKGYQRAGFYVVGVDVKEQPRYAGDEFVLGDAIEYIREHGREFDAIHTSPPCQRYSKTAAIRRGKSGAREHPDLVEVTRHALMASGVPYVIENVVGAPLVRPVVLCGTMFGLRVYRHRLFECSFPMPEPEHPGHLVSTGSHRGYSTFTKGGFICVAGNNYILAEGAVAMGIDWMRNRHELAQSIPPAYTEYVGRFLMRHLLGLPIQFPQVDMFVA